MGRGTYIDGGAGKTLILRWNGHAWKHVTSPSPGTDSVLNAVRATSATNAWAVGSTVVSGAVNTLILRWNGRIWTRVARAQ